jgi:energy-coupling factor transporter ATP-binding protein EcfA2
MTLAPWEPGFGQTDTTDVRWLARVSTDAPRVPWDRFQERVFTWRRGEHVALLGPTGQGKTFLMRALLPLHPFVTVFATKPRDDVMENLVSRNGYQKIERWGSYPVKDMPRRVLWPDATRLDSVQIQKDVFHDAFGRMFREGGWTVVWDETWYLTNVLRLEMDVRVFLLQGRSLEISCLAATQRPANVPLEIYDQSTHLFFWRDNDDRNLTRLREINARGGRIVKSIVMNLEPHQVLYINTRTGQMVRTRVPG